MGQFDIRSFLCGLSGVVVALYNRNKLKLLNILNIIITIIIILLWLVAVFTSIAIWCTSHLFIVKTFVTLFCLLVATLSLYTWLLTKEVL